MEDPMEALRKWAQAELEEARTLSQRCRQKQDDCGVSFFNGAIQVLEMLLDRERDWNLTSSPEAFRAYTARLKLSRLAREILEDRGYRESLAERAKFGTLPPEVEAVLWKYAAKGASE